MKLTIKKTLSAVLCLSFLAGCTSSTETQPAKKEAEKTYSKVLTFGPNCTELFCALGLEDLVIGSTLNNHMQKPLKEYEEAYNSIPELSHSSATREGVLSSGADFIYGIDWEFGEEGIDINEAKDYGIDVMVSDASNPDEVYAEIEKIGKIFQAEDKAQELIKDQKSRIEKARQSVTVEEPVRVLVYDSGNSGIFTAGKSNFETRLIEEVNGKNIFDDIKNQQWTTVSLEEAAARNPEVIIVHDYDTPTAEEKIKEIESNPALSQCDAVKNKRYVILPLESVLPGIRMASSVEAIAKELSK